MNLKFVELMKKYSVTLDDAVLDPAFVSKANTLNTAIANKELTDAEITAADDELVELFTTLHDLTEDDSDEVKGANKGKEIAEAKVEITEAATVKELTQLSQKYRHLPEVLPIIAEKIKKLTLKAEDDNNEKALKALNDAKNEIATAPIDKLDDLFKKHGANPELAELINARKEKEGPVKINEELAAKLRSKKEWSYSELAALGIKATGSNMVVEGVHLQKQYLLTIYLVTK